MLLLCRDTAGISLYQKLIDVQQTLIEISKSTEKSQLSNYPIEKSQSDISQLLFFSFIQYLRITNQIQRKPSIQSSWCKIPTLELKII